MILETCSVVSGAAIRLTIWLSEYLTKRQENKHELEMLGKSIQLEQVNLRKLKVEAHNQPTISSYDFAQISGSQSDVPMSGPGTNVINFANSFIRPFLTIWWAVILYSIYKGVLVYAAASANFTAENLIGILITDFDYSVIGAIIGFYFTNRTIDKYRSKG